MGLHVLLSRIPKTLKELSEFHNLLPPSCFPSFRSFLALITFIPAPLYYLGPAPSGAPAISLYVQSRLYCRPPLLSRACARSTFSTRTAASSFRNYVVLA